MGKILRLLVSAGLLAWLAWRTPWGQIGQAFAHLRLDLWAAAFALYLGTQIVSSLRWQLLARPLGFRQSLARLTGFYFIGMYFNLVLPTSVGGDVVRAWYLDARSGRRLPAFLSVLVDRASGLLVLLSLACVAAALCPLALPERIRLSVWLTGGAALLGLALLPVLLHWTSRFDRARRLAAGAMVYLRHLPLMAGTAGLSVVVQAVNVIVVWLIARAIDAPVPGTYWWIVVPMVTLLTLLPVSVSGMGIREGGMIMFLAPLGVPDGLAVSLAFLWFSIFAAAGLCGGIVYLFGSFPRLEVKVDHETVGDHSHQGRTGQPRAAA